MYYDTTGRCGRWLQAGVGKVRESWEGEKVGCGWLHAYEWLMDPPRDSIISDSDVPVNNLFGVWILLHSLCEWRSFRAIHTSYRHWGSSTSYVSDWTDHPNRSLKLQASSSSIKHQASTLQCCKASNARTVSTVLVDAFWFKQVLYGTVRNMPFHEAK